MKPTRDEILAEPAGPRMDAWVAEWVMGWHLMNASTRPDPDPGLNYWADKDGKKMAWHIHWLPSKDISAAFEVLEKSQRFVLEMRAKNNWIMRVNLPGQDYDRWTEEIDADTPSLVICRVMLLAVLEGAG